MTKGRQITTNKLFTQEPGRTTTATTMRTMTVRWKKEPKLLLLFLLPSHATHVCPWFSSRIMEGRALRNDICRGRKRHIEYGSSSSEIGF